VENVYTILQQIYSRNGVLSPASLKFLKEILRKTFWSFFWTQCNNSRSK